jgi:hypothetical protein
MTFSSVFLASALFVPAQAPAAQPPDESPARFAPAEASDRLPDSMSEHIEILRQILRQKLRHPSAFGETYGVGQQPSSVAARPDNRFSADYMPAGSSSTLWGHDGLTGSRTWSTESWEPSLEGVYLPSYGVVFTATMPASSRDGKPSDDKPASKPISDWDRAQMELRGEKPAVAPPAEARPPSVRDVILRVLAVNGNHLSHLRDDERLTVVVTFRDGGRFGAGYGTSFSGAALTNWNQSMVTTQPASPFGGQTSAPLRAPGVAPQGASNKPPSSARDYELLADLHLKQQEYQTAIEAYAKAIAAYQEEAKSNRAGDIAKELAAIYSRQAQAHLGLGHADQAMELLQQARSANRRNVPASGGKETTQSRVPSKLIISATKRQLDQISQGKISLDEFRKSASIEE